MEEAPQQYRRRILSYVGERNTLAIQQATPAKLARLIRGVSRTRLFRRPAPKKWSIAEIMAHLADTEMVCGFRYRMMLSYSGGPIQAIDQDRWAEHGSYHKADPRRSLALFKVLRAGNLSLLRSLKPSLWKRYGVHSERGKETLERHVGMMAGHDLNHLGQIERIRTQWH